MWGRLSAWFINFKINTACYIYILTNVILLIIRELQYVYQALAATISILKIALFSKHQLASWLYIYFWHLDIEFIDNIFIF